MSSESCEICGPKRQSRALCNCCQQYLCRDHLKEHDDLLNIQLEPLADSINQLADRLKQFDINLVVQPTRIQLEEWKQSAFQSIERIYQEKLKELNEFIHKQIQNLIEQTKEIQIKVSKLIQEQDATNQQIQFLFTKIQFIQKEINSLQNTSIDINIQPFILDNNSIDLNLIKESDELILTPIIQTIPSSHDNVHCITSNDTHILLYRHSSLCLYDFNLNLIKQTHPYSDLSIIDLCWSLTLNRFIILTDQNIFTLDQTKMIIEKSSIPTRTKGHWHNITSSFNYLYLTAYKWGTFVYQYNISSFQLNQRWRTPITCTQDESIDHFIHKNSQLAMILQNRINNNKHFQLRNDQTLECLWSIELTECKMTIHRNRFCSISPNQWIIIDSNKSNLLFISSYGLLKQIINYHYSQPLHAIQIKQNFILIMTNDSVNLHQLLTNTS